MFYSLRKHPTIKVDTSRCHAPLYCYCYVMHKPIKNWVSDTFTLSFRYTPMADDSKKRTLPGSATEESSLNSSRWSDHSAINLTPDQKERLQRAKAYAREMKSKLTTPLQPAIMSATNPHVASGVDARTLSVLARIYVGSIHFVLNESHVKAVFNQFGTIKSISMSVDPATLRHKGFCFIEYETPEAAALALETMNGQDLGGRQLKVGRPNNYATAASSGSIPTPPKSRIYVSNVNDMITEENMASIFEAFGRIKKCILLPDLLSRKHKGCGFIEFEEDEAAVAAIQSLKNFEIGGQTLRVFRCIIGGPMADGMKMLDSVPAPIIKENDVMSKVNANVENLGLRKKIDLQRLKLQTIRPTSIIKEQDRSNVDSVAKEENIHVNSSQRYAVMQKLAASRQQLSNYLLVQNAVPIHDVDDSLKEEFADECSKFGRIRQVTITTGSDDGVHGMNDGWQPGDGNVKIFVEFESSIAVDKARQVLDGRWFGGRRLKASAVQLSELSKYGF
ncbi:hypothetical protein BJV82DRAFT_373506 [Fennellomyces sp. T-0311]|nr:hypothetical protein BJV82DRAFT_373506 [Fennellomyces sp. T-0311]